MPHVVSGCDHCGGVDDHPKLHYGMETYHHDCVPVKVKADVGDHPIIAKIIETASAGTHGDDLRTYINALHQEN